MTRLHNDPTDFAAEFSVGFVAANSRYVRAVRGGVIRATQTAAGTVAVVTGGGSGHYPAFAGLVGQGLTHGAALGNIFASPSTQQIVSVARAANRGGGILLCYGNYAGDVLNFDAAATQLEAEGIPTRTVVVTDDIASAPADDASRRRGVAGDLAVLKVAGTAADAGLELDEVVRLTTLANARTRSLGVAFSGCTLPGAGEPLFTVPRGRMAVGLGIHGEPGLTETDIPTADGLADVLLAGVISEAPVQAGDKVAVILNGLGTITHEELFVTFGRLAHGLSNAGLEAIDPEVGEFCTSLDMAGVSLTIMWLDPELEALWRAPADAAGYRKGRSALAAPTEAPAEPEVGRSTERIAASPRSRAAATRIATAFELAAATIDENVDELGRIDAIAGDGDHGIGMQRGAAAAALAAASAIARGAGAGSTLIEAADAWSDRAGGTSGALWGVALRTLGECLGDEADIDAASFVTAARAAVAAIQTTGGAQLGDKTMVDSILPFVDALAHEVDEGSSLTIAASRAAAAATRAAAATADLVPLRGRARTHTERSQGHPDAGAHSFALLVSALTRENSS